MGAPRADAGPTHHAPFPGAERRRAPRAAVGIPFDFRSSLRFPRDPRGHGLTTDVTQRPGRTFRTDRRLECGEWISPRVSPVAPGPERAPERAAREKRAFEAGSCGRSPSRAVSEEMTEHAYAIEFPQARKLWLLSLFDLVLPWVGVALILRRGRSCDLAARKRTSTISGTTRSSISTASSSRATSSPASRSRVFTTRLRTWAGGPRSRSRSLARTKKPRSDGPSTASSRATIRAIAFRSSPWTTVRRIERGTR